ncbi:MAG: GNAT family N-acetyltransferase [Candidatus Nanoarchaeia archaeon]
MALELIIRRAELKDKPQIFGLGKQVFQPVDLVGFQIQLNNYFNNYQENTSQLDWDVQKIIDAGVVVSQDWYVAVDSKGVLKGFSGIEIPNYEGDIENIGWLNWTGITPELQGNGIGKKLLGYCEDKARKHNISKFGVKTTPQYPSACKMYENNGYMLSGLLTDYYGPEKHLLLYFKRLDREEIKK